MIFATLGFFLLMLVSQFSTGQYANMDYDVIVTSKLDEALAIWQASIAQGLALTGIAFQTTGNQSSYAMVLERMSGMGTVTTALVPHPQVKSTKDLEEMVGVFEYVGLMTRFTCSMDSRNISNKLSLYLKNFQDLPSFLF